ncbi:MAG: ABC transporter permease, partial [Alphaproteobacteria bacterium]|nr:ABC transporter permease [Alphaproteobacteria bacterium]
MSLLNSLPLPLKLGLRELRGGLRGFVIFILCIVLGVAAIGSVGSVRQAVLTGISEHGQEILGADIDLRMTNYPIEDETLAALQARYEVVRTTNLRGMVESATGQ